MRLRRPFTTDFLIRGVLIGALCVAAPGQEATNQGQEANNKDAERKDASESKGLPPRTAPTEYQAHAQAGMLTVAAEFKGHSVPTPDGTYSTEDFVVVEVGLFGPLETRVRLSLSDFSLRVNGKKMALPSLPYELPFKSLKDPEWEPPSKPESKSKTSFGGGGNNDGSTLPVVVHMPIELVRAMEQHVQRAAMLEGDRALPQAGLLFFDYRGKTKNIRSIELIYNGSAGRVTLGLEP